METKKEVKEVISVDFLLESIQTINLFLDAALEAVDQSELEILNDQEFDDLDQILATLADYHAKLQNRVKKITSIKKC